MRILIIISAGLLAILLVACGSWRDAPAETLVVFAASSLTNAFTGVAGHFEEANAAVDLELVFAASSALRLQLQFGAEAGVFASANQRQLQLAQDAGLLEEAPLPFASMALAVAARSGGPVHAFEDLASPGVRLVLAHEEVPAGAYAQRLLDGLAQNPAFGPRWVQQVLRNVVSREANVRQVLAKVQLGEADAAIVYATDLTSIPPGQVEEVLAPPGHAVEAICWIGLVKGGQYPARARAFIGLVRSEEGQALLAAHGFGGPP